MTSRGKSMSKQNQQDKSGGAWEEKSRQKR
jgi:hypothetical protein